MSNLENALKLFNQNPIQLLEALNYDIYEPADFIKENFTNLFPNLSSDELTTFFQKIHFDDIEEINLIGFYTALEIKNSEAFNLMHKLTFWLIKLPKDQSELHKRSVLSQITREINQKFETIPAILLFQYDNFLTISIVQRRFHQKDVSKHVLEKVSLIKDIDLKNPHAGHLKILEKLDFNQLFSIDKPKSYVEIHNAWEETLSIETLNKRFYKDISQLFHKIIEDKEFKLPATQNIEIRKNFVVRLLGRLLFCWFLKHKKSNNGISLISNELLSTQSVNQSARYSYYHAVLEPLFFEILNKSLNDRFEKYRQNPWALTPFLNGGLFEPHSDDSYLFDSITESSIYLNTLSIPNEHLFNLLKTFESYYFTIEENTPLDVQIAVDPEMLGRIFENLLAEINPDTGETARKSSGSYYTPREIVDYMVKQSLISYFINNITNLKNFNPDIHVGGKLKDQFNQLFDTQTNPFDKDASKVLVDLLHKIKIFDPACGSGAFPMGALNQLYHLSLKLMPFQKDYYLKLILLQNCIYGCDIQEIAIEISKLRCFLWLITDAEINDQLENRGIKPLPNLEFKFICANSLIRLNIDTEPKIEQTADLFNAQKSIGDMKKELQELRGRYLTACNLEKENIKQNFLDIQYELFNQLGGSTTQNENDISVSALLSNWNPFEKKTANFLDIFLMFGVKKGFDIVIGNPPYVVSKDKQLREIYAESVFGRPNLYGYFIHASIESFLKNTGILAFINPKTLLTDSYFKNLRKFILKHTNIAEIINIVDRRKVFEAVLQSCIVNFFTKSELSTTRIKNVFSKSDLNKNEALEINKDNLFYKTGDDQIFLVSQYYLTYHLFKKLNKMKTFKDHKLNFTTGKVQWDLYKDYLSSKPQDKKSIKLIWAENLQRYYFAPLKNRSDKEFINTTINKYDPIDFITIGVQRTTAVEQEYRIISTIIDPKTFGYKVLLENNTSYLEDNQNWNIKIILSLLNSKLFDFIFRHINSNTHVSAGELNALPLPIKIIDKSDQQQLIDLVDEILKSKAINNPDIHVGASGDSVGADVVKNLEDQINQIIYKIYDLSEEEIELIENS